MMSAGTGSSASPAAPAVAMKAASAPSAALSSLRRFDGRSTTLCPAATLAAVRSGSASETGGGAVGPCYAAAPTTAR